MSTLGSLHQSSLGEGEFFQGFCGFSPFFHVLQHFDSAPTSPTDGCRLSFFRPR
jgi:hypothetical protein